jgi:hypothetical protein
MNVGHGEKSRMKRLLAKAATVLGISICVVGFVQVPPGYALTIIRNFIGGSPGATNIGDGNLIDIFNAAADRWERAILDPHVLTLNFGWAPVGGGVHTLVAQGGTPNRETEGTIQFNNDDEQGHFFWYLDPTPHQDEEYRTFTEQAVDLGGGLVNVSRVFRDPVGDAASFNHVDLLMVAMHEIGHALGLSMAHRSFTTESTDGDVDVTAPRPFPGTRIPLAFNNAGVTSHIAEIDGGYGTLMAGTNAAERRIPSAIDILVNAQISQFTNLELAAPLPRVTIRVTAPTATEAGPTAGRFEVTRTGGTVAPLTVSYSVTGTATPGSDYVALSGSVTIPAGSSSAQIVVTPLDDHLVEGNETVIVNLTANSNYEIASARNATVTIVSDEAQTTVTISAPTGTATEAGPTGPTAGRFRVTRTGSTAAALTVFYSISGTATADADYTALPGSVVIPAGSTTQNILVTPINDTVMEGKETVIATLTPNSAYTVGSPSKAKVTIVSEENVTIAAIDGTATEAGRTTGAFRVNRTGSTASPLTVFYSVSGTATSASDFTALPGRVTIQAGMGSADIIVTPIDDSVAEVNETVVITLKSTSTYTIGTPRSSTVTIVSNE